MRQGFTSGEVLDRMHSLYQPTMDFFGHKQEKPEFFIRNGADPWYVGTMASTSFRPRGYSHDEDYYGEPTRHATAVVANDVWFPYLYEDELIGVILHELAHVVVGIEEMHGPVWSMAAQEIGGHYQQHIAIRAIRDLPPSLTPEAVPDWVEPWYDTVGQQAIPFYAREQSMFSFLGLF